MSPLAQVKILRVLEYGEFERLGSERMLKTDARIICATNVSLRDRVRAGKFREDLYHRLNGLTILIPHCVIDGRSARTDRERAESIGAAAGKKDHRHSSCSNGSFVNARLARKFARTQSHRANNDIVLRWRRHHARACPFSA